MSSIYSVLQHPDLGPRVVYSLPLETVLGSLRLTTHKVQAIAEDALVEAHVQEVIREKRPMHRLHHMQPHYWTDENLGCIQCKTPNIHSQSLAEILAKLMKHSSGASEAPVEGIALRLQAYLLENVLTSDLVHIEGRQYGCHRSAPTTFSLPHSIRALPFLGRETLAVAQQRGLLGTIEEWHLDSSNEPWGPEWWLAQERRFFFPTLADPKVNSKLKILTLHNFHWREILSILENLSDGTLECLTLGSIEWQTKEEVEKWREGQSEEEENVASGSGGVPLSAVFEAFWLKVAAHLASKQPKLRDLDLGGFDWADEGSLDRKTFKRDDQKSAELFAQLGKLKSLRSFSMHEYFGCDYYGSREPPTPPALMAKLIVEHLPNIEKLPSFQFEELGELEKAIDTLVPGLKKLELFSPTLSAEFITVPEDAEAALTGKCASQYGHIDFCGWSGGENERFLKKKEELRLTVDTDRQLQEALEVSTQVKTLHLTLGLKTTDELGSVLSTYCPQLESLRLDVPYDQNVALTDQFLLNMRGCRALREFTLPYMGTTLRFSVQILLWCTRTLWGETIQGVYAAPFSLGRYHSTLKGPWAPDHLSPEEAMQQCLPTWELCPKLVHFTLIPAGHFPNNYTQAPWFQQEDEAGRPLREAYLTLVKEHGRALLEDARVKE